MGGAKIKPCDLDRFIFAYERTGIVTTAADEVKVSRSALYALKRNDPEFAKRWEAADRVAVRVLEDEAKRRGVDGFDEPVYQGGMLVGHKRRYSDACLIFMLKGNMPKKYGDKVEHTGAEGGAINFTISVAEDPREKE